MATNDWRFPAQLVSSKPEANRNGIGCACNEYKQSKVCRPLAKPTGVPELDEKISDWLRWDEWEPTRNYIIELADKGNVPELKSRLKKRMEFGTAGLRSAMGAGSAFMNDLTLIQATQGLLRYLRHMFPDSLQERGIVVGYDGRYNSDRWAARVAAIFLHARVRVRLFSEVVPTPWVPYAIIKTGACSGVMVTASHNPKEDNGYKVYWENGSQIIPPHDLGIADAIACNLEPWSKSWDLDIAMMEGDAEATPGTPANIVDRLREDPFPEIWESYFVDVKSEMGVNSEETNKTSRRAIVHTSMHGVGHIFAKEMFRVLGLPKFLFAFSQFETDPEFPTVRFPNPEEGFETMKEALKTADENDARLVLAVDPDADRMLVAEKDSGGQWKLFTGNETAALLGWWIIKKEKGAQESGGKEAEEREAEMKNCFMLSSTVSSMILKTMAKAEGFQFEETLTGFKWMGSRAKQLMNMGHKVIFAFEEAIGFMVTPLCCRDKDGISAGGMFGEIVAYLEEEERRDKEREESGDQDREEDEVEKKDRTLIGLLDQVYEMYGYHLAVTSYFICHDPAKIKAMFDRIRTLGPDGKYPATVGGFEIKSIRDLTTGFDNCQPNNVAILPVSQSSQMITFTFFNGCRATLRTSGTEPKVKYYAEMVGRPRVRRDSESANVNQGEEEEFDLPEEKRKVKEELDKVIHAIVLEWFDL